jgi:hypothetical protein
MNTHTHTHMYTHTCVCVWEREREHVKEKWKYSSNFGLHVNSKLSFSLWNKIHCCHHILIKATDIKHNETPNSNGIFSNVNKLWQLTSF